MWKVFSHTFAAMQFVHLQTFAKRMVSLRGDLHGFGDFFAAAMRTLYGCRGFAGKFTLHVNQGMNLVGNFAAVLLAHFPVFPCFLNFMLQTEPLAQLGVAVVFFTGYLLWHCFSRKETWMKYIAVTDAGDATKKPKKKAAIPKKAKMPKKKLPQLEHPVESSGSDGSDSSDEPAPPPVKAPKKRPASRKSETDLRDEIRREMERERKEQE